MKYLEIFQWIFFWIFYISVCYFSGSVLSHFLKLKWGIQQKLSSGFIFNLAVLEAVGWYFVAFRAKTIYFVIFVIAVDLISIIGGLLLEISDWKIHIRSGFFKGKQYSEIITFIILAAVFALEILLTTLYYRSDADDSFYVSNITLFASSKFLNVYDSSFGNIAFGTVPMYDFQIWESMQAVFVRLFGIKADVLAHTVMIPVLLLIALCAYWALGYELTNNKSKSSAFTIFVTIFYLMGGYAVFSGGSFLFSRIWQGKAVYLHVVVPLLLAVAVHQYEKRSKWLWLELLLCLFAGLALNPTSLYVVGYLLLFLMITAAIAKRDGKYILHMLPSLFVAAGFTLMIYLRTRQYSNQISAASNAPNDFVLTTFMSFWGKGIWYFVLFIIAEITIAFLGKPKQKYCFIYVSIALLSIWNPWTGKWVAETLTKTPTYWRVFWLIPAGIGISMAIILILDKLKSKKTVMSFAAAAFAVILILPGKWMFTKENGFIRCENAEKIPTSVLNFGKVIKENDKEPVVLANNAFSTTLRQEYPQIQLVVSRHQYILDLVAYRGNKEDADNRFELEKLSNGTSAAKIEDVELLKNYNVGWVILRKDNISQCEYLEKSGYYKLYMQDKTYNLFRATIK